PRVGVRRAALVQGPRGRVPWPPAPQPSPSRRLSQNENAGESTMQIFREPRVTVLARQEFLGAPHIQWSSDTDVPAQAVAEFAGRVCYLSFGPDAGIEGGHRL